MSTSSTDRASGLRRIVVDDRQLLHVGRIGRPHGLNGGFHVTRPRGRVIAAVGRVIVGGEVRQVLTQGGTARRPLLRLEGWSSRAQVEAVRGADLWVMRTDAPPTGHDEWYAEDLVGCAVVDGTRAVGTVTRLLPYPSCELLSVRRPSGADLLVPLIDDAVRTVDLKTGTIDIDSAFLGEES